MEVSVDYTIRDQQRMQRASRYFNWQASLAAAHLGQRVLEVGCGLGNFTAHLSSRELVIGLDVVPECVAHHRRRFASNRSIESLAMDIVDPRVVELRSRRLDSIACLNVLEHVAEDRQALRHMYDVLPPGGRAVFIVPAFPALYGPIDRNLGHYRRYSSVSWKNLTDEVGFRSLITRYMNVAGFFGWWFNARVLRKTEQSARQIAVFDSVLVPVLSRAEDVVRPPFGQSLFAVLEKR
jgi:SAM-dependent methyltransferase